MSNALLIHATGLGALALNVVALVCTCERSLRLRSGVAGMVWALNNFLMGANVAAALSVLGAGRTATSAVTLGARRSRAIGFAIFAALTLAVGALTWGGWASLLLVAASLLSTYAVFHLTGALVALGDAGGVRAVDVQRVERGLMGADGRQRDQRGGVAVRRVPRGASAATLVWPDQAPEDVAVLPGRHPPHGLEAPHQVAGAGVAGGARDLVQRRRAARAQQRRGALDAARDDPACGATPNDARNMCAKCVSDNAQNAAISPTVTGSGQARVQPLRQPPSQRRREAAADGPRGARPAYARARARARRGPSRWRRGVRRVVPVERDQAHEARDEFRVVAKLSSGSRTSRGSRSSRRRASGARRSDSTYKCRKVCSVPTTQFTSWPAGIRHSLPGPPRSDGASSR